MKKIFDFKRFGLLFRNDAIVFGKSILPVYGAIYGVFLLIFVFLVRSPIGQNGYSSLFFNLLFAGGYIITSMAFQEVHHPQKGIFYLTLPASVLEKFLSRLLLTTLAYTLSLYLSFFVFSALVSGLDALLWRISASLFNPFAKDLLTYTGVYLVTQSIFLFGALYFKKLHLVRTVLSMVGLAFVLMFISTFFARIVFFDSGIFGQGWFNMRSLDFSGTQINYYAKILSNVAQFCFWWLMAPYFWVISYLRLRETEV